MSQPKPPSRLVFVVECTALMEAAWIDMRASVVETLLTHLDSSSGPTELALVLVATQDHLSDAAVESSHWTTSVADFRSLLDAITVSFVGVFDSGGARGRAQSINHVCSLI